MEEVSDPFWADDIKILFKQDRLIEFFVTQDQYLSEKLNSIMRFGIYASILLAMYHKHPKYLGLSIIMFLITYMIYTNYKDNFELSETKIKTTEVPETKQEFTKPSLNNPFGNSSVMDIIDNPKRKPMVDYGSYNETAIETKNQIEDAFNYNLYRDVGDVYGKANSQRQYYTTPSRGTIPNDPDGDFKQWLYGSMPSCKDNNFDCGRTIYESPRFNRDIQQNPLVNPVNIEARKK